MSREMEHVHTLCEVFLFACLFVCYGMSSGVIVSYEKAVLHFCL